jgi:hypothetical protein
MLPGSPAATVAASPRLGPPEARTGRWCRAICLDSAGSLIQAHRSDLFPFPFISHKSSVQW